MKLDHHPRAAIANEQGARGFGGFPMSSMLRQNALEFPALDLCRRDLGECSGNIAIYQASQTRGIPKHTGHNAGGTMIAKGQGSMWETRHLKEGTNQGQGDRKSVV